MKPAKIFYQYVWIISTLRTYRQLTLEQLSQKWQQNGIADGIEVLEPPELRQKMRDMIAQSLKRY